MRLVVRLVFMLVTIAPAAVPAQANCVRLRGDTIDLPGNIVRRILPGPPNYASIKAGDRPDTVWVLRLRRSLCMNDGSAKPVRIPEVQLQFTGGTLNDIRRHEDDDVVFSGVLRLAEDPRDRLPLIFQAGLFMARSREKR